MNEDKPVLDRSLKAPYFFKRGDGYIFATEEAEAWEIVRGQGNWARKDFTYIGRSDGSEYKRIMSEGKERKLSIKKQIDKINADIAKYLKVEERLRFDEVLPETDPKVIRVKEEIAKLEKAIEPLQDEYQNFHARLHQKAFDAEVAKAEPTRPQNQDIITPDGKRDKILSELI